MQDKSRHALVLGPPELSSSLSQVKWHALAEEGRLKNMPGMPGGYWQLQEFIRISYGIGI